MILVGPNGELVEPLVHSSSSLPHIVRPRARAGRVPRHVWHLLKSEREWVGTEGSPFYISCLFNEGAWQRRISIQDMEECLLVDLDHGQPVPGEMRAIRRLWISVLVQGLKDALGEVANRRKKKVGKRGHVLSDTEMLKRAMIQRQAWLWVWSEDFRELCRAVGLRSGVVLEFIRESQGDPVVQRKLRHLDVLGERFVNRGESDV